MTVKNKLHQEKNYNFTPYNYQLLPPEGGWGYLITVSLALAFNVTIVPMTAFGLIYGNFLQSIGDETTGTTLANGIFNTIFNFSGLAANHLLQRYTYRIVGFIGAFIFCIGSFTIIFATNLTQLIISFGVIQGLGAGILVPSIFTAINSYFDKRLNLMNGIAQSAMVAFSMLIPTIGRFLMETYGFRGTISLLAALSLNTFVAISTLQPVEWHMIKKKIMEDNNSNNQTAMKPLLDNNLIPPKTRTSIISIGERAMSVTTINRLKNLEMKSNRSFWESFIESLDLGMFKDLVYLNISIGLSLAFTSDVAFISIIPLILLNANFTNSQTTLLMTIFFGTDLIARIFYSIASAFCKIRNRYVVLVGSFLSAIFRIAFIWDDTFIWKVFTLSALGFLRCFIQTPLPLVFSDEYSDNFATAFSLYMVVCGVVSLLFGPLMSFVKTQTHSDIMVVHLLTIAYLICCLSWIIEIVYKKFINRNNNNNGNNIPIN